MPTRHPVVTRRVLALSALAVLVGAAGGLIARALTALIGLVTNAAYYGRLSLDPVSPAANHLGAAAVLVPVAGGVVVGLLARYGSEAIRGHGIPEAMEQVLRNRSRVPARLAVLKPLSAAIAIGTGGPFGAEGPIIATGGAVGSLLGQVLATTAVERKTLLAAGAAAGMAGTFGSPVSAVLLAIELLLFEYRAVSIVPVALAAVAATAVRIAATGSAPVFQIAALTPPAGGALAAYVVLGAATGAVAVAVTRLVYAVEDAFERLPIHWMWWPALGGIAVGAIGLVAPRTLGVGYDNIEDILGGRLGIEAIVVLTAAKLVSWSCALGSGTSGGTLAPLFTIGAGLGAVAGTLAAHAVPGLGIDPRIAALVAMAAMFAGASRAALASVVFAFETTRQPLGLLPLLGGCAGSILVAWWLSPTSIMTERIVRRGGRVPHEYGPDFLDLQAVRDWYSRTPVTLAASVTLEAVRAWIENRSVGSSHQGFPVLDGAGRLVGVVTRRDIFDPDAPGGRTVGDTVTRPPVVVFEHSSLRDAADQMVRADVGRLPVVRYGAPDVVVGVITRSDLLAAHRHRLDEAHRIEPRRLRPGRGPEDAPGLRRTA